MTKKVLLIYELIPESTEVYILEVSDADLKWMALCHGHYVNFEMGSRAQKACDRLSDFLVSQKAVPIRAGHPISLIGFDVMIHTGMGM